MLSCVVFMNYAQAGSGNLTNFLLIATNVNCSVTFTNVLRAHLFYILIEKSTEVGQPR